jgi:hypothetical protein
MIWGELRSVFRTSFESNGFLEKTLLDPNKKRDKR